MLVAQFCCIYTYCIVCCCRWQRFSQYAVSQTILSQLLILLCCIACITLQMKKSCWHTNQWHCTAISKAISVTMLHRAYLTTQSYQFCTVQDAKLFTQKKENHWKSCHQMSNF